MQRIGLLIAALMIATPIHADENPVKVPFLFTEDQRAPQVDLYKNITRSDALRNHPFLTEPMTRLEYMLIQMERRLNGKIQLSSIKFMLKKNFERVKGPLRDLLSVEGFARYSDDNGKVLVAYEVRWVGRPRIPMRKSCEAILSEMEWTVPQENLGPILYNEILGVLAHTKNDVTYAPMLSLLAANIVHRVSITSITDESDNKGDMIHIFHCQREIRGGEIVYQKFSSSGGGERRR